MKCACAAIFIEDFKVQSNLNRIKNALREAKKQGAEYLFVGEAALNGFDGLTWKYPDDLNHALSQDSSTINEIKVLCKTLEMGLGFGYYENDNSIIHGSYMVITPLGEVQANYRRISPGWKTSYANKEKYWDGNEYCVIEINNKNILIAVCGDLWTDSYLSGADLAQVDSIIWPLYIDYNSEEWNEEEKEAYAQNVKNLGKRTILINSRSIKQDSAKGQLIDFTSEGSIRDEVSDCSDTLLYFDL